MTLLMRKSKKYSDFTFSWYVELTTLPSSLIIFVIARSTFAVYGDFDAVAWVYIVLSSVISVLA